MTAPSILFPTYIEPFAEHAGGNATLHLHCPMDPCRQDFTYAARLT
jgi:hypothetical protein